MSIQLLSLIASFGLFLSITEGSHLSSYDSAASSSSFGEPFFRLEPPSVINFASSKGATIVCLASGSPRPTITWYSSSLGFELASRHSTSPLLDGLSEMQTRPVGNVTNLRQIVHNGAALRLLPFRDSDYRQDIHSTEYRCVASNQMATIHSRSVLVQAVMSNQEQQADPSLLAQTGDQVKVNDEFVTLNSVAVFKCRPATVSSTGPTTLLANKQPVNSNLDSFSNLLEWFTSDGLQIGAGETSKGNKFTAFKSGELHVNQVDLSDLRRTYGCRLRNTFSQQTSSSSGLAQLIVTDSLSESSNIQPSVTNAQHPQVLHTVSQLIVEDAALQLAQREHQKRILGAAAAASDDQQQLDWKLLLPCAIKGVNAQELRWIYQAPNKKPIPIEQWATTNNIPILHLNSSTYHHAGNTTLNNRSRSSQKANNNQSPTSRLIVGPTYLAIEWPRRAHSGRYLCQLVVPNSSELKNMCDINVIVKQPIKLRVELQQQEQQQQQQQQMDPFSQDFSTSMALKNVQLPQSENWISRAVDWLSWPQARTKRASAEESSLVLEPIKVRSRTSNIRPPPLVIVGQRLQLDCLASGYPIESVKWFRNGQPINTQTSNDFQIEITSFQNQQRLQETLEMDELEPEILLSTLIIRQVQAKDVGLTVFECFAQNSASSRARAGLAVFLIERSLFDYAHLSCPLPYKRPKSPSASVSDEASNDDDNNNDYADSLQTDGAGWRTEEAASALFRRYNPIRHALLLEGEPVELRCPTARQKSMSDGQEYRVDWRRWAADLAPSKQQGSELGRNFNQLFSGDARFVINGSSLQIRSPSKRHDEAIYVCRHTTSASASGEPESSSSSSSPVSGKSSGQQAPLGAVHQSSLASSSPSCGPLLASTIFGPTSSGEPMSSISIRIVAKPKIDPFEFSRNLEEGMRTVVVCAVVSGQSPVDITWFKDGDLLLDDEQTNLDHANAFSSTLTFHRIRPSHSGYYTCVAANAFAASNHTSRLLVNEAPYFIEPPKNTQALLGSNVLVNCRAGGQPTPQIRWRKLTPVGQTSSSSRLSAPSGGKLEFYTNGEFESQQMAPQSHGLQNVKFEYRIVTSNSHIQILENGSMIIKEVELGDVSRYVCQAFNGINPSLSEVIDLKVLSPAQFDVRYETVSVKRDSMIKFSCSPKGDLPMQIDWYKEGHLLAPASSLGENNLDLVKQQSKYSEIAYFSQQASNNTTSGDSLRQQRHNNLILRQQVSSDELSNLNISDGGLKSSELFINFADRSDTGNFVCKAKNAFGKDELTYRLVVQEAPDVPLNVQVQNVLANSLKLSWSAPFDGNLALIHFVIEYRKVSFHSQLDVATNGRHSEWIRLVVNINKLSSLDQSNAGLQLVASSSMLNTATGNQQQQQQQQQVYSFVLRQLSAKSTYHIRLAAVNALGQSSFSPHLTVTTAEEPPSSRANDLRAQPLSSSSIKILWRGPALIDEQAPIKGYYISYRRLQQSSTSSTNSPPGGASDNGPNQNNNWLATYSLSAANSTNSDDLMLVRQQLSRSQLDQSQLANSIANYEFILNSLEKNSKYEIRVQPYNSMGVGPASDTVSQTLKFDRPNQPTLKLVAAKRQSLELKWTLNVDEQPLMGFSLFYKCEYDDWQEIQLGIIYQYVIENLRCGNKYQIYLSAFNVVGRSNPSDVLSARTEGTVPIAPDKSQFFSSNITEVILNMSGWQSGGCPISSFMVQYKRLHDSNWFILSEGATPFANSEKITISNLSPATWYKLLITALNEAGTTNAEYVFSTLDVSGEEIAPTFSMLEHDNNNRFSANGGQTGGWLLSGSSNSRSFLSGLQRFMFSPSSADNHYQSEGSLLLPMSCILLLLVTSLASYLYYTRANNASSRGSTTNSSSSKSQMTLNQSHFQDHQLDGRSPSHLLLNRLQSCDPMNTTGTTTTLTRLSMKDNDKQQLVQQQSNNNHHHHHLQHHLIQANTLPLDAVQGNHQQHYNLEHETNQSMLDSFIGNTLMGFNSHQANNTLNHNMKLMSAGNLFASPNNHPNFSSNCTNSSVSTHSTQCFEPSSSSQASSAGGAKAKLQLIDESSLISGAIDEGVEDNLIRQQQFQLYEQQNSPVEQHNNNAIYARNHVNVVGDNNPQSGNLNEANFANFLDSQQQQQDQQQQLYSSANHRLLSTSFASASDLIHRQQQQLAFYNQQQAEDPIYQRLDKFAAYGVASGSRTNQAARSQTLKFNSTFKRDNPALKSMTIQRAQLDCNQQQQIESFYPTAQPYNEQESQKEQLSNDLNDVQQHLMMICQNQQQNCL